MKIEHTCHGKWNAKGVPHKGWSCTSVDDLGEPSQICEMCEAAEIRYAHYMDHPDYPDTLVVGCICAERMEGDYVKPREREKAMKRLAQRRKTWPERTWKTSGKGNPYINTEGYNLTIFPREQGFAVSVLRRGTERKQIGKKDFPTQLEAKNAALTALLWAKTNL